MDSSNNLKKARIKLLRAMDYCAFIDERYCEMKFIDPLEVHEMSEPERMKNYLYTLRKANEAITAEIERYQMHWYQCEYGRNDLDLDLKVVSAKVWTIFNDGPDIDNLEQLLESISIMQHKALSCLEVIENDMTEDF